MEQSGHSSEAAEFCLVAQSFDAFGENAAERAGWYGERATDEDGPDERAVEAIGSRWDELHGFGEACD